MQSLKIKNIELTQREILILKQLSRKKYLTILYSQNCDKDLLSDFVKLNIKLKKLAESF